MIEIEEIEEMTPPLIGITTYGRDEHGAFSLPGVYVDAVRRAGGIPVLLPPGEPELAVLLERMDGLILAGGGDIDPALYNGCRHETIYMLDPERDSSELEMVRRVVQSKTPTLGICRGAQVINVALGGTLIEHLPDVVGEVVLHRLPPRKPARHSVTIRADSRLSAILTSDQIESASWHHQAIRHTAPGLAVVAHAPDGTIEAAEKPDHPWLVAVQWHPELTAADDPVQQQLFDALVEAAKKRSRT
jgi:putative glutamine amidotransferase